MLDFKCAHLFRLYALILGLKCIQSASQVSESLKSFVPIPDHATFKVPTFPTHDKSGMPYRFHRSLWRAGTEVELFVYISESDVWDEERDRDKLVWHLSNLHLPGGRPKAKRGKPHDHVSDKNSKPIRAFECHTKKVNITLTESMLNNASVYGHIFMTQYGAAPVNDHKLDTNIAYKKMEITKLRLPPKKKIGVSLLGSENDNEENDSSTATTAAIDPDLSNTEAAAQFQAQQQPLHYWKPTLRISHVDLLAQQFPRGNLPGQFGIHMNFDVKNGHWLPVLYQNDFWTTSSMLIGPLFRNETLRGNGSSRAGACVEGEEEGKGGVCSGRSGGEDSLGVDDGVGDGVGGGDGSPLPLLTDVGLLEGGLPLEIIYEDVTMWYFTLISQMESQWSAQAKTGMGGSESETDMFRTLLLETNPYLLAATAIVSVLHTVFELLAFKNDVQFWRKTKSMEGLSVRSMVVNFGFHLVIFLYLMDAETSYMVLVNHGISLLIEIWKLTKMFDIALDWTKKMEKTEMTEMTENAGKLGNAGERVSSEDDGAKEKPAGAAGTTASSSSSLLPRLSVKTVTTYRLNRTKEYDEIATHHLLYLVVPAVLGYSTYSLVYLKHKSWYSWLLSSFVGFVYAFGFVMMTPQLFINYKLKSVSHLPWRAMVYKFLNTFIDDLFAFVIKMPTLHRLSCFRDDLIFFIYLYQRWIYVVDKTRTNEFGQGPIDGEGGGGGGDNRSSSSSSSSSAVISNGGSNKFVSSNPSRPGGVGGGELRPRRSKLDRGPSNSGNGVGSGGGAGGGGEVSKPVRSKMERS